MISDILMVICLSGCFSVFNPFSCEMKIHTMCGRISVSRSFVRIAVIKIYIRMIQASALTVQLRQSKRAIDLSFTTHSILCSIARPVSLPSGSLSWSNLICPCQESHSNRPISNDTIVRFVTAVLQLSVSVVKQW